MTRSLFAAILFTATLVSANEVDDQIIVRVVGTLETSVVAIGAETTGTTITAKGITWELDFGDREPLKRRAEQLSGKKVQVEGTLERRPGVEVRERWIVTVTELGEAAPRPERVNQGRLEVQDPSEGAQVSIQENPNATRIEIRCERGIGRATITRRSKTWPACIRLRCYLAGLESLQVSSGATTVEWSAHHGPNESGRVTLREGSTERVIDSRSPYWTPICITAQGDAPNIAEPFFEIPLPSQLFEDNPSSIVLKWVDFFRG